MTYLDFVLMAQDNPLLFNLRHDVSFLALDLVHDSEEVL